MTLAQWVSTHRRSILFLLAVLTLAGIMAATRLPVTLFPATDFPRVAISLDSGDRPASQMMTAVTKPVEQAVKNVPGVLEVRSTTSRGSAELSINFAWGSDMNTATLQIQAAVNRMLPDLPPGTGFDVRRMNPTALYPVTAYALTSPSIDPVALRDIARDTLVPLMSAVPGVASVSIMGGETREIHVEADPALLLAYGLSLDDVVSALKAANVLQVAGRVEDRHKLLLVLADTQTLRVDDIRHIVVHNGSDGVVELHNVARITDAAALKTSIVKEDSHDAVILQVFQQPNGNTVQIVRAATNTLQDARARLPRDLKVTSWYDQSQLIVQSAASVRDAILIGVVLAAAVLFLFLRDAGITLAAIIVVPAVLACTALVLKVLGMTFNIMTLGGMAAAIGLIIDDTIVMIEQIVRHIKVRDPDRALTIRQAVQDFLRPMIGSSASTVIIFLPLTFLSGVTGAFFKSLALTMASALIISFFVSWFAIPLLAPYLLKKHRVAGMEHGRMMQKVLAVYQTISQRSLRQPLLVILPLCVLLGLGFLAYRQVGSGFMPAMDEGGFILDYIAPPGTALADTDHLLDQVDSILRTTPEVLTWSRRTGAQLGGGLSEANTGDFFIRLKDGKRRPIDDIMSDLRQKIASQVPGLDIEMAQLMEDMIGDLTAVPQPIEIKLFSDDAALLEKTENMVAASTGKIDGVIDVKNGIVLAGNELDIRIDPVRAAFAGLDPLSINDQLTVALAGAVATAIDTPTKTIDVRVSLPQSLLSSLASIGALSLRAKDGHAVLLSDVATIRISPPQAEIARDDLKTMIAVTGRIENRDLGSAVQDVQTMLNRPGFLPKSVTYELGGLYGQQQIAFHALLIVIACAFALIFLLLLFLYENFTIALSIILMPLLAVPAVLIGLYISNIELNISAMMGMTMVIGIVTEVAIFFFSEFRQIVAQQPESRLALTEAGLSRFRPIVMTTLAAILALMPLALGLGQGAAMQKPLAITIISGLLVQIPLVLLVMPVLYAAIVRMEKPTDHTAALKKYEGAIF